jgi:HEAT repeat protein
MSTFTTQISEYFQHHREGRREEAYFGLLEMSHEILPELIAAFRAESDSATRAFLVEVIWQHRQQDSIPFLGDALRSAETSTWKQAMDGLVALASPAAMDVLQSARNSGTDKFQSWLEEAIKQSQQRLRGAGPRTESSGPSA